MRLLKKSMAILMAAVMVTTMTPITAEAASKKYVKSLTITTKNLEEKTLVLKKGAKKTIKVKVAVKGGASKKVTYKSSNKKVATVSSKGKITAKKKGSAKITITTKAKNSKGKKLKVTLKVKVGTPVKKVTLDQTKFEGVVGDTTTLKATLSPSKPTVKKLAYSSSKKSVATVDSKGNVTLVGAGTATITVKSTDGSGKKATCKVTVKEKEEETTEAPVYLSYEGYKLDWADEFSGTELDRSVWNVEKHAPGWVNAELQSYVDSKENIYVKDGKLVLNPIQTKNADGTYSYTSGRVNTQNTKTYTYGMFEAKVKVPEGQGYLPAFWLMANDENVYGQWPRCGEIDIMEVHGSNTSKSYGTIHYGNPHKEQQGTYTLSEGSYSDEYHTFTCEWEPGKITWYVDGVKFHEASDWYSTTEGDGTITYPAPFDQPFYIILNLAVGGSWVGNPDDATFQAQPYMIDYVRVYQKEGGYDDSNVTAPEQEAVVIREPDANGNYLVNGDFSVAEDLVEAKDWQFKTANEGTGSVDLSAGNATVTTTNDGTVDYSIQLLQNDVPLIAGQTYVLSYDAYASADRQIKTASKAPNNSWYPYLEETVSLTTTKQTFTHEFKMIHKDDDACTVEFNMGNFNSTATVVIDNVSLKLKDGKIDEAAREAINNPPKSVRADGNYIYNGKFQEGTKHLGFWTISEGADVSVTPFADNRRLKVVVPEGGKVTISQAGVPVAANGRYALSLDAEVPATGAIDVKFMDKTYNVAAGTKGKFSDKFETGAAVTGNDITITFNGAGTYYIDNVRIEEDSIIKNGSFNAGISTGWGGGYKYTSSYAEFGVDSITYDNAASVTITDTDDAEWKIQLKQEDFLLEEGKCYELSFKAWSDMERDIICAIQRNGNNEATKEDWTNYLATQTISLTKNKDAAYSYKFKMKQKSDADSVLAFSMGTIGGNRITDKHVVYIDDVVIEEIDESEMPVEPEIVAGENMFTNADFASGKLTPWELSVYTPGADGHGHTPKGGEATHSIKDGKVIVDVTALGCEDGTVALKYNGLKLENGAKYKLTFKAMAEQTRGIKPCFMDPSANYDWYGGNEFLCEAGKETPIELDITVDKATSETILFQVGLGTMKDTTNAVCDVTMWDFQLVKVSGGTTDDGTTGGDKTPEATTPITVSFADVSLVKTKDANGAAVEDGENLLKGDWGGTAKVTEEEGKFVTTIADPDQYPYSVQMQKYGVNLEAGCTYKVSFKGSADSSKLIQCIVQLNKEPWTVYNVVGGKNPAYKLTETEKSYSVEFTMGDNSDAAAVFAFNLGNVTESTEGQVILPADGEGDDDTTGGDDTTTGGDDTTTGGGDATDKSHVLTFDNFSLVKTANADNTTSEVPLNQNLFERGAFNEADVAFVEGGVNVWDIWPAYAADTNNSKLEKETTYADGVMKVYIEDEGTEVWGIQLMCKTPITLEVGASYKLTFDASSSIARSFVAQLQRTDNSNVGWKQVELKTADEKEPVEIEFTYYGTVDNKVDGTATADHSFNFCLNLGKY